MMLKEFIAGLSPYLSQKEVIRATLIHIRDNVLFELASRNAVDEALAKLDDPT